MKYEREIQVGLGIFGILLLAFIIYALTPNRASEVASPGNFTPPSKTPGPVRRVTPVVSPTPTPKLSPTPTPIPTPTPAATFNDGNQIVGSDVMPGTYRAFVNGEGCYWARLRGFSGEIDDIIANGNQQKGSVIVTIKASDKGFESNGCGSWTRIK